MKVYAGVRNLCFTIHPTLSITDKYCNTSFHIRPVYAWTGWTGWNKRLPGRETRMMSDHTRFASDELGWDQTPYRRRDNVRARICTGPPSKIYAQNRDRERQRHKRDHWGATKTKRLWSKFSDKIPGIRERIGHHRESSFTQLYT